LVGRGITPNGWRVCAVPLLPKVRKKKRIFYIVLVSKNTSGGMAHTRC